MREEVRRLKAIDDPLESAAAVGDFFAALDFELERVALVRVRAVRRLHSRGWSYAAIAAECPRAAFSNW
jgi:hypothetical protein